MASTAPVLLRKPALLPGLARLPELWHLLSLDAPTVAALWAWSFAHIAHLSLPPASLAILALGTWLIYIADRILDGLRTTRTEHLRERHFFHARHRTVLLIGALFAGATLIRLIAKDMTPAARREDCWLFTAAMLYFAVIHLLGAKIERWFPKEIAVGAIFALATAVPAWSRTPEARPMLVIPVLLFAALCCLNCLAIEVWENAGRPRPAEQLHSKPMIRWVQKNFWKITSFLAAAALLLTIPQSGMPVGLCLAAFTSVLLLGLLHTWRHRLSSLHLRIAADAALLTPLLLLFHA